VEPWFGTTKNIIEHPFWKAKNQTAKVVMVTLYYRAATEDQEVMVGNTPRTLHAGDVWTSQDDLETLTGFTRQQIRCSLKKFEALGFATIERTKHGSIITLLHFPTYRKAQSKKNQGKNQRRTNEEPTKNHTQESLESKNQRKEHIAVKFDEFIKAYPIAPKGRTVRSKAREKFTELVKSGIDPDDLIKSAMIYAQTDDVRRGVIRGAQVHLGPGLWWQGMLEEDVEPQPEEPPPTPEEEAEMREVLEKM
jgi:hypothetical protein